MIEPSIDQSKDPKDYGAKVSYEGMDCEVRKIETPAPPRQFELIHHTKTLLKVPETLLIDFIKRHLPRMAKGRMP